MSSTSNIAAVTSIEEADRAWASTATSDPGRRELFVKIIKRLRAELDYIERSGSRGNTTLKVCHPEGLVRKAYLNDRELDR